MKLSKMAATAGLTMTLPAFAWSQHDHSKGYNPCLWGLTLNNADSFLRPEALEPFGSKRVEA
ncbi:MAG TPA: hypothetical protein VLA17_12960 [Candidatus Limnocylindria bacterium]|nr:hypothetical protein [Candidatus Limnocylindria bacterium]